MAGAAFDVYVVGAAEAGPEGQRRAAAAVAGRLGLPLDAVARALADKRLCAGQGMEQAAAQGLARELQALGAIAVVRQAGSATPPPTPFAPPHAQRATLAAQPQSGAFTSPQPGSGTFSPPRPPSGTFSPPQPGSGSFFSAPGTDPGRGDPFSAPSTGRFGAPPTNPGAADPFSAPTSPGLDLAPPPQAPASAQPSPFTRLPPPPASLELDVGPRTSSDEILRIKAGQSLGGASALNTSKVAATSSASGLAVDPESADAAHRVRCPKHGLYYDKRKASGCRKCLEPGRVMAADLERRAAPFKIYDFDDPPKRASVGLAVALAIGLIPAAAYAVRVGARQVHELRGEQEILSRKPGTDESLRRFDAINGAVDASPRRSLRNTALLWAVVSGGVLAGWYRFTL